MSQSFKPTSFPHSDPAVASDLPSDETARNHTGHSCLIGSPICCIVFVDHRRTVLSALPVTSSCESDENANELTDSECAFRAPISVNDSTLQSFTSPSSDA